MKKKKSGDITIKRRAVRLSTMHRLAFKEWIRGQGYSGRYTVAHGLPEGSDVNSLVDAACAMIMNNEPFEGKLVADIDGAVIFYLYGVRKSDSPARRGTVTVLFSNGKPVLYSRYTSMYLGVFVWLTSFKMGTVDADMGFVAEVTGKYPVGYAKFRQANGADYAEQEEGA